MNLHTTPVLELRRKGFFSRDYVAKERDTVVAELSRSLWRARGEITVQGHRLTLHKHGVLKSTFTLNYRDTPVVEVVQPHTLRSKLHFVHNGQEYEMRRKAWYSMAMVVHANGAAIGTIKPTGFGSTGVVVELPDTLPVAVRVLLGWIVIIRVEEAAAAST